MRVFLDEISIWFSGLNKEMCPPQCRQASSNPLRAWIEQKGKERVNSLSLELGHPPSLVLRNQSSWFSGFQTLGLIPAAPPSSGLRPRIGNYVTDCPSYGAYELGVNWPLTFLVLQVADGTLWDYLAFITVWANFYNKLPLIYIYIYTIGFVSLESPG